jgi:hypothetical protein
MLRSALAVLAIEVALIAWARRRTRVTQATARRGGAHVSAHLRSRRQLRLLQSRRRRGARAGSGVPLEADGLPRLRGEHARLPLQADGVHAPRGVPRRDRAGAPAEDPRQPDHDGAEADLGELSRGCRSGVRKPSSSSSRE